MLGNLFKIFFIFSIIFTKDNFRNNIRVSNSVDPDKTHKERWALQISGPKLFAKDNIRREKSTSSRQRLKTSIHWNEFLYFLSNDMVWVLKRTVSENVSNIMMLQNKLTPYTNEASFTSILCQWNNNRSCECSTETVLMLRLVQA